MNDRPQELAALALQQERIWPSVPHLVVKELGPKRLAFVEAEAKIELLIP